MTEANEKKLLEAVAKAHLGDGELCSKLGIEYPKCCAEALKPYADSDQDPPPEVLDRANDAFVLHFYLSVKDKLKHDQPESFFEALAG